MKVTRKDFLRAAFALTAGGTGWAACSSSSTPAGTGATAAATVATTSAAAGTGGATNASSSSSASASSAATTGSTGAGGGVKACTTTIGANHPPPGQHVVTVPAADVNAGADKTYHLQGMADHDHTITVTAAHMATLKSGGAVMVTSTTNSSHSHPVTVMCA